MYQASNTINSKKKKKKIELISNEYNGLKIG